MIRRREEGGRGEEGGWRGVCSVTVEEGGWRLETIQSGRAAD